MSPAHVPASDIGDAGRADLRPRLTRRLRKQLSEGRSAVVVAGPGMGKTWLVDLLGTASLRFVDDATPDLARTLLREPTPVLLTLGVEHYQLARELRDEAVWVPLTNLTRLQLRRMKQPEAWQSSFGHPSLITASPSERSEMNANLRARWRGLLETRTRLRAILAHFDERPDHTPAGHYAALGERHQDTLKADLDWLACAGMVTRFIDGETPGVLPVPGSERLFDDPWSSQSRP